jgi:hypothetical protein
MQNEMSLEVEYAGSTEERRFRWRLKAQSEADRASPETFATRREAVQAGTAALEKAVERGRIGR